jgi:hypothetical protein
VLPLDPFRDRRSAFVFGTNANGAESEALIADESESFNSDWRAWRVAAQRVPEGWCAEFAIPFRSLRYPASNGASRTARAGRCRCRRRRPTPQRAER